MQMSDSIAALAAALAKAQASIQGAKKDASNPYFNSKYADLASVWDACRSALTANGLAVMQPTSVASGEGCIAVETILAHASGEWISGVLEVKPVKGDPQAMGSAITYARRYALAAMVGVAPEDDDGNAASVAPRETTQKREPRSAPQPIVEGIDREIRTAMALLKLNDGALTQWAHKELGTTAPWFKLTDEQKEKCLAHLKKEADLRAA